MVIKDRMKERKKDKEWKSNGEGLKEVSFDFKRD